MNPKLVLNALGEMRPPFAPYEADLHAMVEQKWLEKGWTYQHEAVLAPGARIDFLVEDVGVEIKKGKPVSRTLIAQLTKYAQSEKIHTLIVISQQNVRLPEAVLGKPVFLLPLHRLWGVALP